MSEEDEKKWYEEEISIDLNNYNDTLTNPNYILNIEGDTYGFNDRVGLDGIMEKYLDVNGYGFQKSSSGRYYSDWLQNNKEKKFKVYDNGFDIIAVDRDIKDVVDIALKIDTINEAMQLCQERKCVKAFTEKRPVVLRGVDGVSTNDNIVFIVKNINEDQLEIANILNLCW